MSQGLISSVSNFNFSSITSLVTTTAEEIPWMKVSFYALPIITGVASLLLKNLINRNKEPDLLALKRETTVLTQLKNPEPKDKLRLDSLGELIEAQQTQDKFEAEHKHTFRVKPFLIAAQKNIEDVIKEYTGYFSGKEIPKKIQHSILININHALSEPINSHLKDPFDGTTFEGQKLANDRLNGGILYTIDNLFCEQQRKAKYPNLQRILAREIKPFLKSISDKEEEIELLKAITEMKQKYYESFLK